MNRAFISKTTTDKVVKQLAEKYGKPVETRASRGVERVAVLWMKGDGSDADFEQFCLDHFVAGDAALDTLFSKVSRNFEILFGHFNEINMDLKVPLDLDQGEITPVDELFGAYSSNAHLTEDLFKNKAAFIIMLNFPIYTLQEKNEMGRTWTRKQWAYARLGDMFASREPAELVQKYAETYTAGDMYISEYNICMDRLVDKDKQKLFPAGMKLITHWGIRDELKANYADKDKGLQKQQMIYQVMKRIIEQSIPKEVINNDKVSWEPFSNKVTDISSGKEIENPAPEPDLRYQALLNNFNALKALDPYNPTYPTYIQRAFDLNMELSQQDVEQLFISLLSSPQVKKVASVVSERLGRPLQPFDIWYDGFKSRGTIPLEALDKKVSSLYPDAPAFEADLPNILVKLGFAREKAGEIAAKIQVDPARGSGHAAGALMRDAKARLRTRIAASGMNYKGYNIAIHEFGHNVEQTITLNDVDYYLLNGVPNTAFTEAAAFMFQRRDLELLGISDENPDKQRLATLDAFWSAYEIMGVSLVDMKVWKWLYEHPSASPAQLKEAVMAAAREIWNQYYAPVFGVRDEPILAIYSHMIDNPLYLSNYPIGHLISFQVEQYLKNKDLADEFVRMYTLGRLTPEVWMQQAAGTTISAEPMLKAVEEALAAQGK